MHLPCRLTTATSDGGGPGYSTLSALEAPEPYQRMEMVAKFDQLVKCCFLISLRQQLLLVLLHKFLTVATCAGEAESGTEHSSEQEPSQR
jgi:hypothetical protein